MRVIIVDDEKPSIDLLQIMIKSLIQFDITIEGMFTNVEEVFRLLEQKPIDVIFLDLEMIGMHGLQVAQRLAIHYPNVQIIFVTAHSQFAVDAFEVDATDYVLKPVHPQRLLKALTKAKRKWEMGQVIADKKALSAHTMGMFYLVNQQNEVVKWRTKKVRELFLYLWLHQQKPILNAVIIEVLWPDMELSKSMANLHTAIYQLRQVLKQNGMASPIEFANNHYQLHVEMKSDYEELKQLLEKGAHSEYDMERILILYERDFLESEEYQWAITIQNQLKQKTLYTLEQYASNTACTNAYLKQNILQKMFELDGYNEHYMLLLMTFFMQQNKKKACIELYLLIKERLEEELNFPIPNEIQQIYDHVCQGMDIHSI